MQTYPAATVAKQLSSTFTCMKTYRGAEVMKYSTLKRLPGSAASEETALNQASRPRQSQGLAFRAERQSWLVV